MLFVSVPGYRVNKLGKDHYSVSLTNGNIGAAVIHKDDFDDFVKAHNGKDYRKPAKKIAVGIAAVGLVTAGIMFRKPIKEVATKAFDAMKKLPITKKTVKFVQDSWKRTTTYVKDVTAELVKYAKSAVDNVKAAGQKVATKMHTPKA